LILAARVAVGVGVAVALAAGFSDDARPVVCPDATTVSATAAAASIVAVAQSRIIRPRGFCFIFPPPEPLRVRACRLVRCSVAVHRQARPGLPHNRLASQPPLGSTGPDRGSPRIGSSDVETPANVVHETCPAISFLGDLKKCRARLTGTPQTERVRTVDTLGT
jgi:hypothetical protein